MQIHFCVLSSTSNSALPFADGQVAPSHSRQPHSVGKRGYEQLYQAIVFSVSIFTSRTALSAVRRGRRRRQTACRYIRPCVWAHALRPCCRVRRQLPQGLSTSKARWRRLAASICLYFLLSLYRIQERLFLQFVLMR